MMIVTSVIGFGKSKKEKFTPFQPEFEASTRVWLQCIVKQLIRDLMTLGMYYYFNQCHHF